MHEITSVANAGNVIDIESGAQQTFYAFEVVTDKDGHNLGRTYHFQAESEGLHARWLKILNETIAAARNKIEEANKVSGDLIQATKLGDLMQKKRWLMRLTELQMERQLRRPT